MDISKAASKYIKQFSTDTGLADYLQGVYSEKAAQYSEVLQSLASIIFEDTDFTTGTFGYVDVDGDVIQIEIGRGADDTPTLHVLKGDGQTINVTKPESGDWADATVPLSFKDDSYTLGELTTDLKEMIDSNSIMADILAAYSTGNLTLSTVAGLAETKYRNLKGWASESFSELQTLLSRSKGTAALTPILQVLTGMEVKQDETGTALEFNSNYTVTKTVGGVWKQFFSSIGNVVSFIGATLAFIQPAVSFGLSVVGGLVSRTVDFVTQSNTTMRITKDADTYLYATPFLQLEDVNFRVSTSSILKQHLGERGYAILRCPGSCWFFWQNEVGHFNVEAYLSLESGLNWQQFLTIENENYSTNIEGQLPYDAVGKLHGVESWLTTSGASAVSLQSNAVWADVDKPIVAGADETTQTKALAEAVIMTSLLLIGRCASDTDVPDFDIPTWSSLSYESLLYHLSYYSSQLARNGSVPEDHWVATFNLSNFRQVFSEAGKPLTLLSFTQQPDRISADKYCGWRQVQPDMTVQTAIERLIESADPTKTSSQHQLKITDCNAVYFDDYSSFANDTFYADAPETTRSAVIGFVTTMAVAGAVTAAAVVAGRIAWKRWKFRKSAQLAADLYAAQQDYYNNPTPEGLSRITAAMRRQSRWTAILGFGNTAETADSDQSSMIGALGTVIGGITDASQSLTTIAQNQVFEAKLIAF